MTTVAVATEQAAAKKLLLSTKKAVINDDSRFFCLCYLFVLFDCNSLNRFGRASLNAFSAIGTFGNVNRSNIVFNRNSL